MAAISTRSFDLIIFDCDGVLVDSEVLSAEILMKLLGEFNVPIDLETFRRDFLGRSFTAASHRLLQRTGRSLPVNFHELYLKQLIPCFEARLKAMAGVEKLLRRVVVPFCVASSSNPLRLGTSLRCSGLESFFVGSIFSGTSVKNPKPAPDLFLHAAARFNVSPARCLVIEDSEMGVMAARAAGMTCWQFCGGSHFKGIASMRLPDQVEHVVDDMVQLLDMMMVAGLCSPTQEEHKIGSQT